MTHISSITAYYMYIWSYKVKTAVMANIHLEHELEICQTVGEKSLLPLLKNLDNVYFIFFSFFLLVLHTKLYVITK